MEELPLVGFPTEEAERRREWLKLPRKARAAIRQLHKVLGHKPRNVVLQILRGAKAPEEYIQAAKLYRCDTCAELAPATATHKVAPPKPYIFNHELIIDVLEVKDSAAKRYSFLNILCAGTTCQRCVLVAEGGSQPSSRKCLSKFLTH